MTQAETVAALPPLFDHLEEVTAVVSGKASDEWYSCAPGGKTYPMLGVRLADGRLLTVPVGYPGIKVIHGDILPTLAQALRDAMEYRDCDVHPECTGRREQYEKALDVLGLAGPIGAIAGPGADGD